MDAADATVIEVVVTGRRVFPAGRRFKVRRGGLVRVIVTGDRADELHVHGYDRTVAVTPGRPSTVRFVADLPGVFEAELHESGLLLFELQVG